MKAVALLSGGLDSSTALAVARDNGMEITDALTISYGQRHDKEVYAARRLAEHFHVQWNYLRLDAIGLLLRRGSALVNPNEPLPHNRDINEMVKSIPRSYVPGRNTMLLAIAQAFAEAHDIDRIVCGFNAVDYSGYPDCRPEFVEKWNELARFATKRGIELHPIMVYAPIILMSKIEIVHVGYKLGVPFEMTWSCYEGREKACGKCDSCIIRRGAFEESGLTDPVEYADA